MTIDEAEKQYVNWLSQLYDPKEARSIFILAATHVLKLSRSQLFLKKHGDLSLMQETSLIQLLDELKEGRPIQYVLGETEFYGLPFKVNSSVLIPRPETEELVDWILNDHKGASKIINILDIGTGSGCIPISLKKNLASTNIWGVDISYGALETSIKNAVLNQVSVKFIHGDILDQNFTITGEQFDVVVSNPPYIKDSEKDSIHRNVLAHEPHLALFVPDHDALLFYKAIADFATRCLRPGGVVYFEVNEALATNVADLLKAKSFSVEIRNDIQGKERMVRGKYEKGQQIQG